MNTTLHLSVKHQSRTFNVVELESLNLDEDIITPWMEINSDYPNTTHWTISNMVSILEMLTIQSSHLVDSINLLKDLIEVCKAREIDLVLINPNI
jgi:hypothetical protein